MGLTRQAVGKNAGKTPKDVCIGGTVALMGNPNVGKSTLFNALTGLRQHTGNWPGKTVELAMGECKFGNQKCTVVDLPGCYSLLSHSPEEEVARDYLYTCDPKVCIVVCDATALRRNLGLVLQTLELTDNCIVCINLLDEAERKGITIDLEKLQSLLGVTVVGTSAGSGRGIHALRTAVANLLQKPSCSPIHLDYGKQTEEKIEKLLPAIKQRYPSFPNPRWLALRMLEGNAPLPSLYEGEPISPRFVPTILMGAAAWISKQCVFFSKPEGRVGKIDRLLTGKWTAFPLLFLLMAFIFWLTMQGANYPSEWLQQRLFALEEWLYQGSLGLGLPVWLCQGLWHGVYRVTAWVVSVMLPPMAIFFPLFTLMEDVGLLPRIAFNLDRGFQCCNACGKQSLCMMMGLGCNAAGVVGCRIIDSRRERLIAMITNSFMPCNGRFPTLIALLSMFVVGIGLAGSLQAALCLAGLLLLAIGATFAGSYLLSVTLLKGEPSSFTLELPPYRRPRVMQVLVRSMLDRTLFVLARAIKVAAPAGAVIWLLANISVGEGTLLQWVAAWLHPIGSFFGMDGVILLAFLLALPANEILLPLILMGYTGGGVLTETETLTGMKDILIAAGWDVKTAVCVLIFCLMHWPCSTTLLTIKKESGGWRWAILAAVLPTLVGLCLCAMIHWIF